MTKDNSVICAVYGKSYKNKKGIVVEAKNWIDFKCRCKCNEKLSLAEKEANYKSFRNLGIHNMQNGYLRGCSLLEREITLKNGKIRRKYKHIIRLKNRCIDVCQLYFTALHGISRSRLRKKVLMMDVSVLDGRGRHFNHRRMSDTVVDAVKAFLENLQARSSHYTSKIKNKNRKYLESNLSISSLRRKFLAAHEDISEKECNYYVFRKIFRRDFNYAFGMPRADICTKCERLQTQLNCLKNPELGYSKDANLIKNKQKEIDDHTLECEHFFGDVRNAKTLGEEYHCICFDYEKNLPLPKTSISNEYFLRQLWCQNFGIYDIKTDKATMFLYSEHYARKGANEVISCLKWYVENKVPLNVKYLYLFCDNCSGQNKNKYVFSYLQYLADTRFEKVVVFFPEPGHSRMPIDKAHGKIEKLKLKFDKIDGPSTYVYIISTCQPSSPFEIVYVQAPLTDDLISDGRPVISVGNFTNSVNCLVVPQCTGVRAIRHMVFSQDTAPLVNSTPRFKSKGSRFPILQQGISHFNLQEQIENVELAYNDFLSIMPNKFHNIKFLLKHVYLPETTIFYDTLYYKKQVIRKKPTKSELRKKEVETRKLQGKSRKVTKGTENVEPEEVDYNQVYSYRMYTA